MASIKTKLGREKLAKAHAGQAQLPAITHIAFGTGGIMADQLTPRSLTGDETKLFNEVIRKSVIITNPNTTTVRYSQTLDAVEDNLIGRDINEACLIDSEGTLIAIKTFKNKGMEIGTTIDFDYDAEY